MDYYSFIDPVINLTFLGDLVHTLLEFDPEIEISLSCHHIFQCNSIDYGICTYSCRGHGQYAVFHWSVHTQLWWRGWWVNFVIFVWYWSLFIVLCEIPQFSYTVIIAVCWEIVTLANLVFWSAFSLLTAWLAADVAEIFNFFFYFSTLLLSACTNKQILLLTDH